MFIRLLYGLTFVRDTLCYLRFVVMDCIFVGNLLDLFVIFVVVVNSLPFQYVSVANSLHFYFCCVSSHRRLVITSLNDI